MTCVLTSFGRVAPISLQALLHFAGGLDGVLAGLLGDDQRDGGHAVEAGGGARLLVAVLGEADVGDLDDVAVAVGDGDLVELRGVGHAAGGADREFLGAGVEAAAGQLQVLRADGVEDVGDGEVVGAQPVGIDHHVNLAARAADDGDLADALGVLELLLDLLSAIRVTSRSERGAETAICRIGAASGSNFCTIGSLAVSGRLGTIRLTLFWTSCAATSPFLSSSKVMRTSDWPSEDVERSSSTC